MNKQDILIRLLKEEHITNEEFKLLYEDVKQEQWFPIRYPNNPPPFGPYWGIQDPTTGDFIGTTC